MVMGLVSRQDIPPGTRIWHPSIKILASMPDDLRSALTRHEEWHAYVFFRRRYYHVDRLQLAAWYAHREGFIGIRGGHICRANAEGKPTPIIICHGWQEFYDRFRLDIRREWLKAIREAASSQPKYRCTLPGVCYDQVHDVLKAILTWQGTSAYLVSAPPDSENEQLLHQVWKVAVEAQQTGMDLPQIRTMVRFVVRHAGTKKEE